MKGDARRPPAVAGTFYPDDAEVLAAQVGGFLDAAGKTPRRHLAVMAPHAGYVYSGGVAGAVFADTAVPERVIVLAPNHTGRGEACALWPAGAFALPGYDVPVDEALGQALLAPPSLVTADHDAHRAEHALEVELPFLRARQPSLRVTPIIVGWLELDACLALGARLAEIVASLNEDVLVVASSDMSHYLPDATAREVDHRALEPLLALDPEGLFRRVRDEDISMCGVLPATVMLAYARARAATRAELVAYATSGDAFGDRDRVVGYAAVTID
jgi:MEMO1 family protein